MPPRRHIHKGVQFKVSESTRSGFFTYEFQIGGVTIVGHTRTQLRGIAVHRARRAIDRKVATKSKSAASVPGR